jgi:hypothetical protein
MVDRLISNHSTVRQQFEAMIAGIEQEALAAARVLGFETDDIDHLVKALDAEQDVLQECDRDVEVYFLQDGADDLDESWSRAICIDALIALLSYGGLKSLIGDVDIDDALEMTDNNLALLRLRLPTAGPAQLIPTMTAEADGGSIHD